MRLAGLVLAGGLGSRMGGDVPKPLLRVGDRTSLERALACLQPFCTPVLVSTNDPAPFADFELDMVRDRRTGRLGPLAGLEAAAARLAERRPATTHLICTPGDTPFLPSDLVPRLLAGSGETARIARCGGRLHPTISLWPLPVLAGLTARLDDPRASRSLMAFLELIGFEPVDFPADPDAPDGDPFFNVNTQEDLQTACRHLNARAAADRS